jgi:hypothetical protein
MLIYWLILQVNADMVGGLDDAESYTVGGRLGRLLAPKRSQYAYLCVYLCLYLYLSVYFTGIICVFW